MNPLVYIARMWKPYRVVRLGLCRTPAVLHHAALKSLVPLTGTAYMLRTDFQCGAEVDAAKVTTELRDRPRVLCDHERLYGELVPEKGP